MTESNHWVKCSYYSHQIPITPIADFLSLPQAGIASLSLFVLLNTIATYIWYTFCHVSFLSTPISLLLPKRLVALLVPCSIILIDSLGTYASIPPPLLSTHILETLMGLFAFSFSDLGLWVSSNLLNLFFFFPASSFHLLSIFFPYVWCMLKKLSLFCDIEAS